MMNLSSLYVRETDETKVVTRYERYTDNNLPELNKESTNKTDLKDEVNDKTISDDKTGKEESEPDRVPDKQNDEVKTAVNNKTTDNKKAGGYKIYAILVLAGVCLAVSLILILLKKNRKNHLFVGIVGICGILFILFTDFSSPEDYYGQAAHKENIIGKVTMSIRCDILANEEKKEHIPDDYCILEETVFEISEGETAYDILLQGARQFGISVEHEGGSDLVYVSGINYLYEHDYGDLSGWVYKVNGSLPSVGCAGYKLKDKDKIEWCYTLNLGNDVLGE